MQKGSFQPKNVRLFEKWFLAVVSTVLEKKSQKGNYIKIIIWSKII